MIYDVAIIGAGPAGSMLSRLLTGKKIALFDARPLDRPYQKGDRIKSCGGLLAPDSQAFLKKLGITLPPEIIDPSQPSKGIKTTDLNKNITRYYKRNYINLDREAFDRFLLKDINADCFFSTLVNSIKDNSDHFVINNSVKAKIIVGADGAGSIVRRIFFPSFKPRQYASIQEIFSKKSSEFECFFDHTKTNYYGWALPKGSNTLLGFALPAEKSAPQKFSQLKKQLNYSAPISKEGTIIIRPKFFHPITCSKRVFLIGEAGGYISPSSAEGISYAFKTAQILANSQLNINSFRYKMLKIKLDILYKNLKSIFMYNRILRQLIMHLTRK